MAKAKQALTPKPAAGNVIQLEQSPDETNGQALARAMLDLPLRHGHVASSYGTQMLGKDVERGGIMDNAGYIRERAEAAAGGDMTMASQMLAAQAVTLDTIFTGLAERMFNNLGQYPQTAERYGRLALKAQANARATIEALAKLHQPREQTVRHVHVGQGGQAVVADEFHHHTGGAGNANNVEQPYEQGACGPALPGPNPTRDGVPIASAERPEALQPSRRTVTGRAEG